jgi:hypothetical protein
MCKEQEQGRVLQAEERAQREGASVLGNRMATALTFSPCAARIWVRPENYGTV